MPITWQRQHPHECWITALSMVTGKTLTELHEEFRNLAGLPYHEAKNEPIPYRWWNTVNTMQQRHRLLAQRGSALAAWAIDTPTLGSAPTKYLTASLLYGKGILAIQYLKRTAHAVAFENGYILDPQIEGRTDFKDWKRHYRLRTRTYTWRIDRVY